MRSSSSTISTRGLCMDRVARERQAHGDDGAAASSVACQDLAVVLLEDTLHERQAETRASPPPPEERLEQAWQIRGAKPRTLIRNRDFDHVADAVAPSVAPPGDRDAGAAGR